VGQGLVLGRGFLKIDLLGLGMLSAVEDCVDQIARTHDEVIDLSRIPFDDEAGLRRHQARGHDRDVPDREPRADAEPPAHEAREPRRPHRPGRARTARPDPGEGRAPVHRRAPELREDSSYELAGRPRAPAEPLRSTFGVVVFQDQVLEVAIALAGFTVGEAEGLRRAMSRKRSHDALEAFRERFIEGAAGKGVDAAIADTVFDKLVGFSGFGFPKAHAAAFGLLAYQSTWLRHYYPAEFLCALLNEQPMGFYPPRRSSATRSATAWRCSPSTST
jgi:error-prone DNA polymerase